MERAKFYRARNNEGEEAQSLLDEANIDYELHYWPEQADFYTVPVLECPYGAYRGTKEIREFVYAGLAKRFAKI